MPPEKNSHWQYLSMLTLLETVESVGVDLEVELCQVGACAVALERPSTLNFNSRCSDYVTGAFVERNAIVVFIWVSYKGLGFLFGSNTMRFLCQPYHTKVWRTCQQR